MNTPNISQPEENIFGFPWNAAHMADTVNTVLMGREMYLRLLNANTFKGCNRNTFVQTSPALVQLKSIQDFVRFS